MKVLWFSNTPAYGENYLQISGVRGGWLKSLDRAIKNKVELHIAFYFTKYVEPFEYEGVHYYPISNLNWKFNVLKKIVFGELPGTGPDRLNSPTAQKCVYLFF